MKKISEYLEMYGALPLLKDEAQVQVRTCAAGETVCLSGNTVHEMMLLAEGRLQVESVSADGKYGQVARILPPQLIGDIELLRKRPYLHTVTAETDAILICFPMSYVHRWWENDVEFYRFLCGILMDKLYDTSGSYSRILVYPAINLLADFILNTADQTGVIKINGIETAGRLGITSRHLSRLLTDLTNDGILSRLHRGVYRIIDYSKLDQLSINNKVK